MLSLVDCVGATWEIRDGVPGVLAPNGDWTPRAFLTADFITARIAAPLSEPVKDRHGHAWWINVGYMSTVFLVDLRNALAEQARHVTDATGERWAVLDGVALVRGKYGVAWRDVPYMTREFLVALRTARADAPATDAEGDRWFFVDGDDVAHLYLGNAQWNSGRMHWCTRAFVDALLTLYELPIINLCTA